MICRIGNENGRPSGVETSQAEVVG